MENADSFYGVEEIAHDPGLNDIVLRMMDLKSASVMITDHEELNDFPDGLRDVIVESIDSEIEYISAMLTTDWNEQEAAEAAGVDEVVYIDE